MTKAGWKRHMDELGLVTRGHRADPKVIVARQHIAACSVCKGRQRQARSNRQARERYAAMLSVGMTKTPYGWE